MPSLLRNVVWAALGTIVAACGMFHAATSYPGQDVFVRVAHELPTLGAVLSFSFGVAASLVGLVIGVPALMRLRRPATQSTPSSWPASGGPEEQFEADPKAESYGFGEQENAYERYHHGNGYGGYPADGFGSRPMNNARADQRARAGAYR
jgi:hypothetical protein